MDLTLDIWHDVISVLVTGCSHLLLFCLQGVEVTDVLAASEEAARQQQQQQQQQRRHAAAAGSKSKTLAQQLLKVGVSSSSSSSSSRHWPVIMLLCFISLVVLSCCNHVAMGISCDSNIIYDTVTVITHGCTPPPRREHIQADIPIRQPSQL
jgi:hypothetical protein